EAFGVMDPAKSTRSAHLSTACRDPFQPSSRPGRMRRTGFAERGGLGPEGRDILAAARSRTCGAEAQHQRTVSWRATLAEAQRARQASITSPGSSAACTLA